MWSKSAFPDCVWSKCMEHGKVRGKELAMGKRVKRVVGGIRCCD